MGGTVLAGLTAPKIADHWGLSAPFWVAAGAARRHVRRLRWRSRATRRRAARTGPAPGMFAVAVGVPHEQRPRMGADAVLLPRLRRLRRDVPLPAEAADRRARPDQGRRRRPRRRLRAARGRRPPDRRLAVGPHRRRRACCSSRSSRSGCSRSCSPPPTRRWCRSRSPASPWRSRSGSGSAPCSSWCPSGSPTASARVTGVVGAAGGLGGFFPPLVIGAVGYTVGFVLMAAVAMICLGVLAAIRPRAVAAPA